MKIKAIIFDIDDTIFDRNMAQNKVIKKIYNRNRSIFCNHKYNDVKQAFLQSDKIADVKYKTDNNITHFRMGRSVIFLDLLNIDIKFAEIIKNDYLAYYPRVKAEHLNLYKLFRKIRKRYKIGIISNGFSDIQYKKLETLKVKKYCDSIVLSEDYNLEKPNKKLFEISCKQLDVKPKESIYVGDNYEIDIVGANKAGLYTIWLNENKKKISNIVKPDWQILKLKELYSILTKLQNGA